MLRATSWRRRGSCIDAMSNLIQNRIVNGLAHILDGLLGIDGHHNLELASANLIGGEYPDFPTTNKSIVNCTALQLQQSVKPSCHLLLVDLHRLGNVIHLRFHLIELLGLQLQQLHVVVGQSIDLVGDTG